MRKRFVLRKKLRKLAMFGVNARTDCDKNPDAYDLALIKPDKEGKITKRELKKGLIPIDRTEEE